MLIVSGVLFITMLFNALQAFAEVGTTLMGRPIINNHRGYAFHRPAALWIGSQVGRSPVCGVQQLLFLHIRLFYGRIICAAGTFFIFYLFVVLGYVCMSLFFRCLWILSPDFDYALKFAATSIIRMILMEGYMIPYQSMPPWIKWFYWIK